MYIPSTMKWNIARKGLSKRKLRKWIRASHELVLIYLALTNLLRVTFISTQSRELYPLPSSPPPPPPHTHTHLTSSAWNLWQVRDCPPYLTGQRIDNFPKPCPAKILLGRQSSNHHGRYLKASRFLLVTGFRPEIGTTMLHSCISG